MVAMSTMSRRRYVRTADKNEERIPDWSPFCVSTVELKKKRISFNDTSNGEQWTFLTM